MDLTAEQRIQKAHIWLMKQPKYCLYSGIFMMGKTSVEDGLPTAATDGYNTYYGREFTSTLNEKELRAVILHENLHKAFRHIVIWRHLYKDQPMLANCACDYVINLMIHDSDPEGKSVKLPSMALLEEKYRGMDAGTVFKLLKKDVQEGKNPFNGRSLDEHDWEKAKQLTPEEIEKVKNEIEQALRQGKLLAGKMGVNVPREIGDILDAKVNWKDALRDFVTSFCQDKDESTWKKPSRRRIGEDIYMPSSFKETIGRVVIGIDMSGSIGPEDISQFLGEVKNICDDVKPEGIDLLYWDTDVCQHEKYEQAELNSLLQTTKPRGGGGTDVNCVFNYVDEKKIKAECVIVLTDGYTPFPESLKLPTIFAMTTDVISPVGINVRI